MTKRLEDVHFKDTFDCVLLRNTLHHLREPNVGISQAMAALRPGGRVVLCEGVPPDSQVRQFYTDLFALFDNRHIITEADLLAMLRTNGFKEMVMQPYFMENVDLFDWLRKVSPNDRVYKKALGMHMTGDAHFRQVYEVNEEEGRYTMTWRFIIVTAVKP